MGPIRVLLVDPVHDDWEIQALVLGRAGHTVIAPGENPLKTAVDEQPDVIVVDVTPERFGAADFIKVLKNDRRTAAIPVVVVSTLPRSEVRLGDGFVGKPHTPSAILAELSRVLKR